MTPQGTDVLHQEHFDHVVRPRRMRFHTRDDDIVRFHDHGHDGHFRGPATVRIDPQKDKGCRILQLILRPIHETINKLFGEHRGVVGGDLTHRFTRQQILAVAINCLD